MYDSFHTFFDVSSDADTVRAMIAQYSEVEMHDVVCWALEFDRDDIAHMVLENFISDINTQLPRPHIPYDNILECAIHNKRESFAIRLVELGADVSNEHMSDAIKAGMPALALALLDDGVKCSCYELTHAMCMDTSAVWRAMLKQDINLGGCVDPLLIALKRRDEKLVLEMLDRGARMNGTSLYAYDHDEYPYFHTPLGYALKSRQTSIVDALVSRGAAYAHDVYALRAACETGDLDVVQMLVASGTCVNEHISDWRSLSPNEGDCALDVAVMYGHEDIAMFLLDSGAHSYSGIALQCSRYMRMDCAGRIAEMCRKMQEEEDQYWRGAEVHRG